jgi:hypothetical protein
MFRKVVLAEKLQIEAFLHEVDLHLDVQADRHTNAGSVVGAHFVPKLLCALVICPVGFVKSAIHIVKHLIKSSSLSCGVLERSKHRLAEQKGVARVELIKAFQIKVVMAVRIQLFGGWHHEVLDACHEGTVGKEEVVFWFNL